MRRLHRPGVVARAVKAVPIYKVLTSLGVPIESAPEPGTTQKIWCPFSYLHPDGGKEREMRIYPDNKAFCHVCVQQYDSVSLAAAAWGCAQSVAAERLLAGQAAAEQGEAVQAMYVVRAGAVAALAEWADAHGVDRFSPAYRRCLEFADHISADEHVAKWLAASKRALTG